MPCRTVSYRMWRKEKWLYACENRVTVRRIRVKVNAVRYRMRQTASCTSGREISRKISWDETRLGETGTVRLRCDDRRASLTALSYARAEGRCGRYRNSREMKRYIYIYIQLYSPDNININNNKQNKYRNILINTVQLNIRYTFVNVLTKDITEDALGKFPHEFRTLCLPACLSWIHTGWLTELWFYAPIDTKSVISETFPQPTYWRGVEKLNRTQ